MSKLTLYLQEMVDLLLYHFGTPYTYQQVHGCLVERAGFSRNILVIHAFEQVPELRNSYTVLD